MTLAVNIASNATLIKEVLTRHDGQLSDQDRSFYEGSYQWLISVIQLAIIQNDERDNSPSDYDSAMIQGKQSQAALQLAMDNFNANSSAQSELSEFTHAVNAFINA